MPNKCIGCSLENKPGCNNNCNAAPQITNAQIIAKIIYHTDSRERTQLLFDVAQELKTTDTNYTAQLIEKALLTD